MTLSNVKAVDFETGIITFNSGYEMEAPTALSYILATENFGEISDVMERNFQNRKNKTSDIQLF